MTLLNMIYIMIIWVQQDNNKKNTHKERSTYLQDNLKEKFNENKNNKKNIFKSIVIEDKLSGDSDDQEELETNQTMDQLVKQINDHKLNNKIQEVITNKSENERKLLIGKKQEIQTNVSDYAVKINGKKPEVHMNISDDETEVIKSTFDENDTRYSNFYDKNTERGKNDVRLEAMDSKVKYANSKNKDDPEPLKGMQDRKVESKKCQPKENASKECDIDFKKGNKIERSNEHGFEAKEIGNKSSKQNRNSAKECGNDSESPQIPIVSKNHELEANEIENRTEKSKKTVSKKVKDLNNTQMPNQTKATKEKSMKNSRSKPDDISGLIEKLDQNSRPRSSRRAKEAANKKIVDTVQIEDTYDVDEQDSICNNETNELPSKQNKRQSDKKQKEMYDFQSDNDDSINEQQILDTKNNSIKSRNCIKEDKHNRGKSDLPNKKNCQTASKQDDLELNPSPLTNSLPSYQPNQDQDYNVESDDCSPTNFGFDDDSEDISDVTKKTVDNECPNIQKYERKKYQKKKQICSKTEDKENIKSGPTKAQHCDKVQLHKKGFIADAEPLIDITNTQKPGKKFHKEAKSNSRIYKSYSVQNTQAGDISVQERQFEYDNGQKNVQVKLCYMHGSRLDPPSEKGDADFDPYDFDMDCQKQRKQPRKGNPQANIEKHENVQVSKLPVKSKPRAKNNASKNVIRDIKNYSSESDDCRENKTVKLPPSLEIENPPDSGEVVVSDIDDCDMQVDLEFSQGVEDIQHRINVLNSKSTIESPNYSDESASVDEDVNRDIENRKRSKNKNNSVSSKVMHISDHENKSKKQKQRKSECTTDIESIVKKPLKGRQYHKSTRNQYDDNWTDIVQNKKQVRGKSAKTKKQQEQNPLIKYCDSDSDKPAMFDWELSPHKKKSKREYAPKKQKPVQKVKNCKAKENKLVNKSKKEHIPEKENVGPSPFVPLKSFNFDQFECDYPDSPVEMEDEVNSPQKSMEVEVYSPQKSMEDEVYSPQKSKR